MILKYFDFLLLCLILFVSSSKVRSNQNDCPHIDEKSKSPQQVHLSFGRKPSEIVITWTTFDSNDTSSYVQFGVERLDRMIQGDVTPYTAVDDNIFSIPRILYIHRVILTGLKPDTRYIYRCGTKMYWSQIFTFKTLESYGTDWSPRMLVLGDMGWVNARSIPYIKDEVDKGNVDLVFHNGDIGYNLPDCHSKLADAFMNLIEPIAANIPYQFSPGNHEAEFVTITNFSNYIARTSTYDQTSPSRDRADHYYAFYLGPALIISYSTEVLNENNAELGYFNQSNIDWQNQWLEAVLKEANLPANRAQHPWIIALGHRPLYCTVAVDHDGSCTTDPVILKKNLEHLFYKYGVDLLLFGHQHSYERTYPLYKDQILISNASEPYTNPRAPVHIINGNAGHIGGVERFDNVVLPWSAFRREQYGYGIVTIVNSTHLVFEQVDTDGEEAGQVTDRFTIIQEKHGSFENWN